MNKLDFQEVPKKEAAKIRRRASAKERVAYLDRFVNSGLKIVKVTGIPEGKEGSVMHSLYDSVKRYGYKIRVFRREKNVYMERVIDP